MSASLVGSEMCIRDSRRPSAAERHGRPSPASLASRPAVHVRGRPPRRRPVSYTHLTLPRYA
eukprot:8647412-Alexandrium_andersonii.AAC.1